MLEQKIRLRTAHVNTSAVVYVVQNDTGRSLLCFIEDYDIPEGSTSEIVFKTPSGKKVPSTGTIIPDSNSIKADIPAEAIAEYGKIYAKLEITYQEKMVSTFTFVLDAQRDISSDSGSGGGSTGSGGGNTGVTISVVTAELEKQAAQIKKNTSDISQLSEDKITSPATATVGQILAVKAVDESGKPTEFEAVNQSGASGDVVAVTPEQTTFIQKNVSKNKFNRNSTENSSGYFVNVANGQLTANANYTSSHPIQVDGKKTYTTKVYTSLYGASNATKICLYDKSMNFIQTVSGTVTDGNIVFTVDTENAAYARVTVLNTDLAVFMFVEGETYPTEYVPHSVKYLLQGVDVPDTSEANASFFTMEDAKNLYNPEDAEKAKGNYINRRGVFTENARFDVSGCIPVEPNKTYCFPVYDGYFGAGQAIYVPYFDADKNYVSFATGTLDAENHIVTVTFTSAKTAYMRVNIATGSVPSDIKNIYQNPDNFMVVENQYPMNRYIPYGDIYRLRSNDLVSFDREELYNPLVGKSVMFTGDSICNGASAGDGLSGYAGRIGRKNKMLWSNLGISGATITSGTSASFYITDTDFGAGADYIILEGGTNDADIIGDARTAMPEKFGTYDIGTFTGEFDKTTFCGAVESLFQRVTTDYAGKKIGFIIAHKMGTLNTTTPDYTIKGNNRRKYFETIMELCGKWGIPCLNLWDGCYLNPQNPAHYSADQSMYTDGQHLTSVGYEYIAQIIDEWMKGISTYAVEKIYSESGSGSISVSTDDLDTMLGEVFA